MPISFADVVQAVAFNGDKGAGRREFLLRLMNPATVVPIEKDEQEDQGHQNERQIISVRSTSIIGVADEI